MNNYKVVNKDIDTKWVQEYLTKAAQPLQCNEITAIHQEATSFAIKLQTKLPANENAFLTKGLDRKAIFSPNSLSKTTQSSSKMGAS
eukprot:4998903-Ditylum_brightwellii.AAC.1